MYDDMDKWCVGPCMNRARHKVRDHQEALRLHDEDLQRWYAYLDQKPAGVKMRQPIPLAPPRIIPIHGNPIWCGSCTASIRQQLAELDDLACIAAAEADGHRGAGAEARVTGSHESVSLSPITDDLDELDRWLRDWRAAYLGEETMVRRGGLADAITTGVSWLLARVDRLLARRDIAVPFGEETTAWHARLARFGKADVRVLRKPLRCPNCSRLTLEWREGDDKVSCRMGDCGRVLLLQEYEALVEQAAGVSKEMRRATGG